MLNTKIPKSFFWLGVWMLSGQGFGPQDLRRSKNVLDMALDYGIKQWDTAPIYGRGQGDILISKFFKKDIKIASKTGLAWKGNQVIHDGSASFIQEDVDQSLLRLKRDYIDIMYLHWPDPKTPLETSLFALEKLKKQGKIKAIGLSNVSIDEFKSVCATVSIDYLQLKHSLVHNQWDCILTCQAMSPKTKVLIYNIFEQGLFFNPNKALGSSDRRNKNPYFSNPYRKLIQQTSYFKSTQTCLDTINNWLNQLSKTITGAIVGVRNETQLQRLFH